MEAYTLGHHRYLMQNSPQYRAMTPAQQLAVLGYAHNQGAGGVAGNGVVGAQGMLAGQGVGHDANNTSGMVYYDRVAAALGYPQRSMAGFPAIGPRANPWQPLPSGPGLAIPGPAGAGGGGDGRVIMDLNIHGAAPGSTANVRSNNSNVTVRPRIETIMPTALPAVP